MFFNNFHNDLFILSDNLVLSSLEKSSNLVSYSISVGQTSNYFAVYITP